MLFIALYFSFQFNIIGDNIYFNEIKKNSINKTLKMRKMYLFFFFFFYGTPIVFKVKFGKQYDNHKF